MNDPLDDPPVRKEPHDGSNGSSSSRSPTSFFGWLRQKFRPRNSETSVRDTLDELIGEREEAEVPIDENERLLLANILDLRDRTIHDVMIPRVDIVSLDIGSTLSEVIRVITSEGHSRIPVYRDSLDDAVGMVHIKDILEWRARDREFSLSKVLRRILFVSPSMRVLELLLEMRVKRSHMALVVDEFGGVDGLVTIEDLVEEIVGEIEDEHDSDEEPTILMRSDGTFDADARAPIELLEERVGRFITDEEREDIGTLGGLVFRIAGCVPIRGELVSHSSGLEFEVLDADPRRVKRLRIRGSINDSQEPD